MAKIRIPDVPPVNDPAVADFLLQLKISIEAINKELEKK